MTKRSGVYYLYDNGRIRLGGWQLGELMHYVLHFDSVQDARDYIGNAGISEWDFGGYRWSDIEGQLAVWMYRHVHGYESFEAALAKWIWFHLRHDPRDYGLDATWF
jgi:hypothetical protein